MATKKAKAHEQDTDARINNEYARAAEKANPALAEQRRKMQKMMEAAAKKHPVTSAKKTGK